MMYTLNSENTFVGQVVKLRMEGRTWAEISERVNKPIHEIEELPNREPQIWADAMEQLIVITQRELVLRSLMQIQALLLTTTDAKALASLVNALARLMKATEPPKGKERSTPAPAREPLAHPIPTPTPNPTPVSVPVPLPKTEPVEDEMAIRATLALNDRTRYFNLRRRFRVFEVFLVELHKLEPGIYHKLRAKNLLPPTPNERLKQTG